MLNLGQAPRILGARPAGGEFQTTYNLQPMPSTTASDGIIVPPPTGLACPNYSCFSGVVLRIWDPKVQPALDDQWNLTLQHRFGNNTSLQVGYVGQRATHLMVPFNYGQLVSEPSSSCAEAPCTAPSPYFAANEQFASLPATITGTQSNGNMTYNSLQAVLQKTVSHGLQYQVAYTYSKCMTNNSGYYGTWSDARASRTAYPYWQNIYDPKAEWAPCYYDSTNTLTAYAIYDLPFGRGKEFGKDMNKVTDAVVGGWTISPILSLHSGFPMSMYTNATDPTGTGITWALRPDCNGTNTVWGRRDATASQGGGFAWFDPSNYSDPTTTFGTCAPQLGHLRGPGYYNWDISLQKNFQITERFKLQFRSDFLNAFNAVNLAAPNTGVNTPTFGVINFSQPARNIQFALKLYY
jgi:hypothetical protein